MDPESTHINHRRRCCYPQPPHLPPTPCTCPSVPGPGPGPGSQMEPRDRPSDQGCPALPAQPTPGPRGPGPTGSLTSFLTVPCTSPPHRRFTPYSHGHGHRRAFPLPLRGPGRSVRRTLMACPPLHSGLHSHAHRAAPPCASRPSHHPSFSVLHDLRHSAGCQVFHLNISSTGKSSVLFTSEPPGPRAGSALEEHL